ncbi:MBL fold metallo-hydrolase [Amorphus orientalis]|nr:MBL fold metallo-hydrolase [Amorphus orientalis]
MFTLGQATVRRIVDIDRFALPLDFLFPDASLAALGADAEALAPDHLDLAEGAVLLGIQSHLIEVGGLRVLIDTCVGEHKERALRPDWHRRAGGPYLPALAAAGVTPDDIDIVLCTHLHADHVGWNTRLEGGRWVPTFPNARYLVGRTELEHWSAVERKTPGSANHGAFADSVAPIVEAGLCETVEDGFEITAGLTIVPLAGHSPGQVGLEVAPAEGPAALFCGDAIHSPVQVIRPDWSSRFCHDGEAAARLRLSLLDRAADDGSLLVPAHLRRADALRADRRGTGFRPVMVSA